MVELAVFFSLLALLSYLSARTREVVDFKFVIYGWLFFPLTLLLAILSKEIGVLVLVYILIIEMIVFKINLKQLSSNRHVAFWLWSYIFIPVFLAAAYLLTHFDNFSNYSFRTFTLYERLLTQLHVLVYYMRLIIAPRVKDMSLFQDDFPITHGLDVSTLVILGALFLLLVLIWYLRYRAPIVAFGLAWFFGSHLLESTFIPLELVFEHRNYLASIGLLLPIIYYVMQIQKKPLATFRWFLALFFIVFIGETHSRVQEWSNKGLLLTVAVNDHPNSARARTEYSNYLHKEGRTDEAMAQLLVAMNLNTRDAGSVMHELSFLCANGKRSEELMAEAQYRLQTWPASSYAMSAMTTLMNLIRNGTCKQMIMSDVDMLIATALSQPGNLRNVQYYAHLLDFLGMRKFDEGEYEDGTNIIMQAYDTYPDILRLSRLLRIQLLTEQYDSGAQTIVAMERQNARRFGTETYVVKQAKQLLADATNKSDLLDSEAQNKEGEK
jgi:hypothetical protein